MGAARDRRLTMSYVSPADLVEWADTLRFVQSAAAPLVGTAFHETLSRLLESILAATEARPDTDALSDTIGHALDEFDGSGPLEDFLAVRLTSHLAGDTVSP